MTQLLENCFADQYAAMLQEQRAAPHGWMANLRAEAFERFQRTGLPSRHDEEWRFTPIGPILETAFERPGVTPHFSRADLSSIPLGDLACLTLRFVNGRFAPQLSDPGDANGQLRVSNLAALHIADVNRPSTPLGSLVGPDQGAFAALNTALAEDGALVQVAAGFRTDALIHIQFITSPTEEKTVTYPRVLIEAGPDSEITIVESYAGGGDGTFSNSVTEVSVGENAIVKHYKLAAEDRRSYHIGAMQVQLARSATFTSHSVTLGGAIVRNDVGARLLGEGCECTLNGLYLANGKMVVDNHTSIDHAMPHCNSHELYKGILDDSARGVFNGKIFVRQDAQKTDAKQTNKTLLLSERAQINTKPQLEIFADDVRCTHGATIGQLNSDALFYLRTRGIGPSQARAMLTRAFALEVVERIEPEPVRDTVDALLATLLPRDGAAAEERS